MATSNNNNQQYANNADGFTLGGGTTVRSLTLTGANATITGSGTNIYTFPGATDTIAGLAAVQAFTNKTFTDKISITTGSNKSAGTGTLASGTVTISTTAVTSSSLIFLQDTASSLTNVGILSVSAKVAGTSFTVTSANALDASTFNWLIIN